MRALLFLGLVSTCFALPPLQALQTPKPEDITAAAAAAPIYVTIPSHALTETKSKKDAHTHQRTHMALQATGILQFTQWSRVANPDGTYKQAASYFTVSRWGAYTPQGGNRFGMAFFRSAGNIRCLDQGYGYTYAAAPICDIKPGDVRNFQTDFFDYLGTVNSTNEEVTNVPDNDPRWVYLGAQGNNYNLPNDNKVYIVRWGTQPGNWPIGFTYRNFQGRFRCTDQWFADPVVGAPTKHCWYFNQSNNYLTATEPTQHETEKGQWVDCAQLSPSAEPDCVFQTDRRPIWVRLQAARPTGGFVSAYMLVDTPNMKCSSYIGWWFRDVSLMDLAGSNGMANCAWFNPASFHFAPSGYWSQVVSGPQGAALSYSLTYGVDSSVASSSSQEYSLSVTTTVSSGFAFASAEVSTSFSTSMAQAIENAASVSAGHECAISTCVGDQDWITNVMWAWKMDIGEVCSWGDSACVATVNTCNFWCTSAISKPPACPPGACKDKECQTCNTWAA